MDWLSEIQWEVGEWNFKNFPNAEPWQMILGMQEELGELSHAYLKRSQNIRTDEDHDAEEVDAIGDLVIYILAYCDSRGIHLPNTIRSVWAEVSERDWNKYPKSGGLPPRGASDNQGK